MGNLGLFYDALVGKLALQRVTLPSSVSHLPVSVSRFTRQRVTFTRQTRETDDTPVGKWSQFTHQRVTFTRQTRETDDTPVGKLPSSVSSDPLLALFGDTPGRQRVTIYPLACHRSLVSGPPPPR